MTQILQILASAAGRQLEKLVFVARPCIRIIHQIQKPSSVITAILQSHLLYYLPYMQTIHRKEEITVWWLFNNCPMIIIITIVIIIIWRIFLHKSVWIFVFYMYIHTLYLAHQWNCAECLLHAPSLLFHPKRALSDRGHGSELSHGTGAQARKGGS